MKTIDELRAAKEAAEKDLQTAIETVKNSPEYLSQAENCEHCIALDAHQKAMRDLANAIANLQAAQTELTLPDDQALFDLQAAKITNLTNKFNEMEAAEAELEEKAALEMETIGIKKQIKDVEEKGKQIKDGRPIVQAPGTASVNFRA